jgi:polysaccharide biosynthesis/export protein
MIDRNKAMSRLALWGVAISVAACSSAGSYVWVQSYAARPGSSQVDPDYVIGVGDTVGVKVYEQESVTTKAKVRADGRISVALVGDVIVAGKRPADVGADIALRLKQYINSPSVTVSVEEVRPISIAVVGEVNHPGIYQLEPASGVLVAVAAAGGATDFADNERVFVLRKRPAPERIRFTYEALVRNEPSAAGFVLRNGDTVVVE